MSSLYVGQKVRKVALAPINLRHLAANRPIGSTGIISEISTNFSPMTGLRTGDYQITWDGGGPRTRCFPWQLEPLTPPHEIADADFVATFDEQFRTVFAPEKVS